MILKFMSGTDLVARLKVLARSKKTAALLAGAFLTLAFAPIYFFPAVFIALSAFYLLLEGENTKKDIFWIGFAFGFGHFLTGIYWIAISLLVDASQFGWLIPFALMLIPGALAVYFGILALLYSFFSRHLSLTKSYQKIILFALVWLIAEILRSNLFSGFPWNLLGYSWMFNLEFSQLGSVFGIYGLSILAVLTALVPVIFWKRKSSSGDKIYVALIVIFLISNFAFGHFYIDDKKLIREPQTKIRLVQGNIEQNLKWNGEERYQNFLKHVILTNSKDPAKLKAVIWPESAVPYVLNKNPQLTEYITYAVPENGVLITGGLRAKEQGGSRVLNVWNSVFVLNKGGVTQSYDKHHLVPFGEFVPFHKLLSFLYLSSVVDSITGGGSGFTAGDGPKTIVVDGFSFSPLVCYEVIFSSKIIDKNHVPDVLINVTNDAWFGNSSGPYQHFDMARMRAIEYGIPLIRTANTGISAFVDPFGRIIDKLPRNEMAIHDIELVKNSQTTIYTSFGMLPTVFLVLLLLLPLITNLRKNPNVKTNNPS